MPSETFFRLPDSKQQRIIKAIKEEIARSSYDDFSIGSIIRECSISRGSFYQYFHNKEDIYLYFISGYQKQIFERATDTLRHNGGDFFDAFEVIYRFAVRMLCYKDSKAFRHNLFCNMHLYELLWHRPGYTEYSQQLTQKFFDAVNIDLLRLNSAEELRDLFDICLFSMLKDMAGIVMADYSEQTVLDHFQRKFNLLKQAYQK